MTDQQLRTFVKQQQQEIDNADKRTLHMQDVQSALVEFGVNLHRPPFLEDVQAPKYSVEMPMKSQKIMK